ncbi:serine protease inhibitor 27A-like [Formica exsecta]|uniref:serine protease inhibitor 27A-like n=1 Tax=Formica exsecta TaxID=72781 RepID=UPI0011423075|nr:serine protease inhibitor 27A-like [Formica exsecta]
MIIFLPNEKMEPWNLKYLEKKINFTEFKSIRTAHTNKLQKATYLYLPKFTSEYTQNITDFFRQKGVNTMFEDSADFTRLSKIPLKVNNIVQTVSVKINEGSSKVPKIVRSRVRKPRRVSPPQKLIIDRPFCYLIEVYGELMFAGTVRAPDFIFMKDEL